MITQRELRNRVSEVLRQVEGGASLTVTVRGRPAAELVPVTRSRRFVPRATVERIVLAAPLDPQFADDVDGVLDETIDRL